LHDLASDLNILLPGHEDEYVSRREGKMNLEDLLNSAIHVIFTR